jgi:tetratricopeptide (TPR) repeat protein
MSYRTTMSVLITIFVMHLSFIQAWAEDRVEAERVFGFAESLYEEGDYFRAIGEYKRYIYLAPTDNQAEKAAFRIAEGYFHAKRWAEAIIACDQYLSKYPASYRYFEMLYFKGRVEKFSGRYEDSLRSFELITNANAPNYMDKAQYQKALVKLERTDWRGTQDALRQVPPGSPLFPAASLFAAEIEKMELPYKSPATAGLLAAVLPGAGHLYAERPRDALVAFLLNGAFIWGTVELFHHDNYMAGSVFAFFELGWYSGNIYSAVSSVHKYNRNKESDFIQKMKDNFSLALYRDEGVPTIIISHRF